MAKLKLCIELLSPRSLSSREEGGKILELWEQYLPNNIPDRVGNYEPLRTEYRKSAINSMLDLWQWPYLAKKREPLMNASVFMRKPQMLQHSSMNMEFLYNQQDICELLRFLDIAVTELEADLCCMTLLTDNEIQSGRENGSVYKIDKAATKYGFMITSKMLSTYLPDVYWLTYFGTPYIELFGNERLLSVPAYRTMNIDKKCVRMQLTSDIADMYHNAISYQLKKKDIKDHLGLEAYYECGREKQYSCPRFVWKA